MARFGRSRLQATLLLSNRKKKTRLKNAEIRRETWTVFQTVSVR
jgi:hypothetical protein